MATVRVPRRLRPLVFARLAEEPIAQRRSGRLAKSTIVALLAASAAVVAVVQFRSPGQGQLAYAAVEESMRQIRTATWTEHLSIYEEAKKKTSGASFRVAARMNPPALSRALGGTVMSVMKPETLKLVRGKTYSTYFDESGWGFWSGAKNPPPPASEIVRREILRELMAPTPGGWESEFWTCRKVVRDGRALWRFDGPHRRVDKSKSNGATAGGLETVEQSQHPEKRLTSMGFRNTLWVDPDTRRVVRSEQEMYTGNKHTLTVADGFVYDKPLSDAVFTPGRSR